MFSRRQLLVGGVAVTAVAACGRKQPFTPPTSSDPAEPLPPFEDRIGLLEKRDNALVGLYAGDFASTNDVGIVFGPKGEHILLAIMTRTRSDNPEAQPLRQLIADVTTLALPTLRGQG